MFSSVIDELFENNLYKTANKVINFLINPRILGILENVEEKSRDFLLERDWKLYSCICMKHKFPGNTLHTCLRI